MDRPAGRAAGLAAAALRGRARPRLHACATWPAEHCVKCLVFYHPDDPAELCAEQERQVLVLADACRRTGHELLLEVIPGKSAGARSTRRTLARAMDRFYALGVYPDWWKLPHPGSDAAWAAIAAAIARHDPHCRGVLLLGLEAPRPSWWPRSRWRGGIRSARASPSAAPSSARRPRTGWPAGSTTSRRSRQMAAGYRRLIDAWEAAA